MPVRGRTPRQETDSELLWRKKYSSSLAGGRKREGGDGDGDHDRDRLMWGAGGKEPREEAAGGPAGRATGAALLEAAGPAAATSQTPDLYPSIYIYTHGAIDTDG